MKKKLSFIALFAICVLILSACNRGIQDSAADQGQNNTIDRMQNNSVIYQQEIPAFTDSTYYSEEKNIFDFYEGGPGDDYEALPPGFSYLYTPILYGDLSEFAGTWVNGYGEISELWVNGDFGQGFIEYGDFAMNADGSYFWSVYSGIGSFRVQFYPVGIEVTGDRGIIFTDTSKDRIYAGHETPHTVNQIFYLQETNDFETEYYDGWSSLMITGYTGNKQVVIIPSHIHSLPVTHIGYNAFAGKQLTRVIIPDNVTYIGDYAFAGNQLTNVIIPGGLTFIDDGVFSANQLTSITIPGNVTFIGDGAFQFNRLTSVIFSNSVTYIGPWAFAGNPLTGNIYIPNGVVVGEDAFNSRRLMIQ